MCCIVYSVFFVVCLYNVFQVIFYVHNCVGGGYNGVINFSRFRVFHIWLSIVMVSAKTNFLVLIYVAMMYVLFVLSICTIFGSVTIFFYFFYNERKDGLYFLFDHIIYNWGILDVFGLSIYVYDR